MAPPLDLKDLRNLSKRDPSGYHAEFLLQYRHFQTQLQIFLLKPAEDYKPFSDLVDYLCHVCLIDIKE
jgi:protein SDA1